MGSTNEDDQTLWNTGRESGSRDRPLPSEVSRLFTGRLTRALTTNRVETDPWSDDPRLLGRTYAIPFEAVWRSCVKLVREHAGWRMLQSDDLAGFIRVHCTTRLFRQEDDLEIHVGLDEHGLTRVDLRSRARSRRVDLGTNARRVGRFSARLDESLGAGDGKILDPRETARMTRRA